VPLTKLDGQYYLKLTVADRTGLFAVDFADGKSYLDSGLKRQSETTKSEVKVGGTHLG